MRTRATVLFATALIVAALSLLLTTTARAEDVVMLDGTIQEAEVLGVEDDGIRVTWRPAAGGVVTMKIPAARLDPHYFYNLRDQAAGADGRAHLKLALWAFDEGLFNLARVQVRKAAKADPALVKDIEEGKLPAIREGIASHVLASAERDMKAGRLALAEEKLEALLVRMPDTEAGAAAREVMQRLQILLAEHAAKAAAEEQAKLDEAAREEAVKREELLGPAEKELARARMLAVQALQEDSDTKALELLEESLRHGRRALTRLEDLAREHAEDEVLRPLAARRRASAIEEMGRIHLHRADLYLWRGSLKQARDEVEAARALLPDSTAVATAWQRILEAETDDAWDLRWQRARREGLGRFAGGGGRR